MVRYSLFVIKSVIFFGPALIFSPEYQAGFALEVERDLIANFRRHQVGIIEGIEEQVVGANFHLDADDRAQEGDVIHHGGKLVALWVLGFERDDLRAQGNFDSISLLRFEPPGGKNLLAFNYQFAIARIADGGFEHIQRADKRGDEGSLREDDSYVLF